jgi:phosphatidate cytidylyltransferase
MADHAPSNLAIRLLTAAVGAPAIIALLYVAPPWGIYILAFPASMIGTAELFAMTHPNDRLGQGMGVLLAGVASAAVYFFTTDARVLLTVFVAIPTLGPLLTLVRLGDMNTAALRACALGVGPLFVAVPLTLLAVMRRDLGAEGPGFVVMTIMFAWFGDSGGYFAGRFFGKHKLYEAVSPKKTVEGAIGGLVGSMIGAVAASLGFLRGLPLWHALTLAVVAGASGQAGDLAESLLKRSTGKKDSGNIVPGHGGILDRVDALIVTAQVVYLYTLWMR